ncbi:hypothetical protein [Streptomyces antimycoticus]|uniref:hypothetical protein n=1 Tax=Streptomyces antimycoticus TaxID=68175 RepID=UPI0036E1297D
MDDDQPRTVTYYAPRPRPIDPRSIPTGADQVSIRDIRQVVGGELPVGFDWAPRRPVLLLIECGDPAVLSQDEILVRAAMIQAIARWGVRTA